MTDLPWDDPTRDVGADMVSWAARRAMDGGGLPAEAAVAGAANRLRGVFSIAQSSVDEALRQLTQAVDPGGYDYGWVDESPSFGPDIGERWDRLTAWQGPKADAMRKRLLEFTTAWEAELKADRDRTGWNRSEFEGNWVDVDQLTADLLGDAQRERRRWAFHAPPAAWTDNGRDPLDDLRDYAAAAVKARHYARPRINPPPAPFRVTITDF